MKELKPYYSLLLAIVERATSDYKVLVSSGYVRDGKPVLFKWPIIKRGKNKGSSQPIIGMRDWSGVKRLLHYLFGDGFVSDCTLLGISESMAHKMQDGLRRLTKERIKEIQAEAREQNYKVWQPQTRRNMTVHVRWTDCGWEWSAADGGTVFGRGTHGTKNGAKTDAQAAVDEYVDRSMDKKVYEQIDPWGNVTEVVK